MKKALEKVLLIPLYGIIFIAWLWVAIINIPLAVFGLKGGIKRTAMIYVNGLRNAWKHLYNF